MKKLIGVILALACAAPLSPSSNAQKTLSPSTSHADTSSQQPRAVGDENSAIAAAASVFTGTLQATFTIHLITPVPTGGSVLCTLNASITDAGTAGINNEISDTGGAKATISGSTATCLAKIPYSWYLADAGTDTVKLDYTLAIIGSATSTTIIRENSAFIPGAPSIKVPASGSTTSFKVSTVL